MLTRLKNPTEQILATILTPIVFLLLSPVIIILKFTGEGTVFFIQEREGKDGVLFPVIKLCTMYKDQDSEILEDSYEQRQRDKGRITPMGFYLRKFCIDEFPQIINIMLGQMSFCGPRPRLAKHVAKRPDIVKSVRPGITGLEQTDPNRDAEDYDPSHLDEQYAMLKSIWLDLVIIFIRTPKYIFSNKKPAW